MSYSIGTLLLFGTMTCVFLAQQETAMPNTVTGAVIFSLVSLLAGAAWVVKWMASEITARGEQLNKQRDALTLEMASERKNSLDLVTSMKQENQVERDYRTREREQQAKFAAAHLMHQKQVGDQLAAKLDKILTQLTGAK